MFTTSRPGVIPDTNVHYRGIFINSNLTYYFHSGTRLYQSLEYSSLLSLEHERLRRTFVVPSGTLQYRSSEDRCWIFLLGVVLSGFQLVRPQGWNLSVGGLDFPLFPNNKFERLEDTVRQYRWVPLKIYVFVCTHILMYIFIIYMY